MKLTVVIVSYNVCYYLEQCLVSVLRATEGLDREIFVVDNDSHDDTVSYLKQRFGTQITLIESQHNLGFARANNIAIRQSTGQYVLLLNPDTFVAEDAIQTVITFMDAHPRAGGAGVMMHNADGTRAPESRRALPTPWVSLLKMFGRSSRYYMTHLPWDQPARIDVMSGAFCMLRREALNHVGLLDEDFFMYGEDIDLSYRITKGGYENWYVPAHILHYKGESTVKSSYRYVHVFYEAMLIFFRKHYGHLSLLVTLPIRLAIYFRAFMALVSMQTGRLRQSLGMSDDLPEHITYQPKGSQQMLAECNELLRRKGLTVNDLNPQSPTLDTQHSKFLCTVYDTCHFSFGDIIAQASADDSHPMVGTYSTDTHILITPQEVIR